MQLSQRAYQELPAGYGVDEVLDLSKNKAILVTLSLASLVFFVLFGVVFFVLLYLLRPDLTLGDVQFSLVIDNLGTVFISLLIFLGVVFVMLVSHEGIHGLVFWAITGGRVDFGFKGVYAYAAAPDWYLTRKPYMMVSLAPLLVITLFGFLALLMVPAQWIWPLFLLITMNASGAVGDIYVFYLLLRKDNQVLIKDHGDRMEVYKPVSAEGGD